MNGKGMILEVNTLNFPNNDTKKTTETAIFEEVRIESAEVSEIKTKDEGTRFARLKRVLRKRSASIL
jgi:hypothetical protein